jgi:preprotein translocase subunit SecA
MKGIAQDFVRYVMHVQVVRNDPQPATSAVQNVQQTSFDTQQPSAFDDAAEDEFVDGEAPAPAAPSPTAIAGARATARQGNRPAKQETVVKDEWAKTPRNAPCPCGSGKKFKMCHGAA